MHLKMREEENKLSFQKRMGSNRNNNSGSAAGHYQTADDTTGSQATRVGTNAGGYEHQSALRNSMQMLD